MQTTIAVLHIPVLAEVRCGAEMHECIIYTAPLRASVAVEQVPVVAPLAALPGSVAAHRRAWRRRRREDWGSLQGQQAHVALGVGRKGRAALEPSR